MFDLAGGVGARGGVHLALEAMATRFELVLHGSDTVHLRAAGEDALHEIARLDRQLSFYNRASDVSWINAHAARAPVAVEGGLFGLVRACCALSAATGGAFDITIAPLMHAWRFVSDGGAVPEPDALAAAQHAVGYRHLELDERTQTIRFLRPGMSIDFGAAGKGYAIDRAISILRDHDVPHALLHGGTSSVHAIGGTDELDWTITWAPSGATPRLFRLRDGALSVSAAHGKSFTVGAREYGHVMDPRTGRPGMAGGSAVVSGPGSLECDALSTALLVLGAAGLAVLQRHFPEYQGAVA